MPLITTRVTAATDATLKGSPLTNAEIDNNFINLNNAINAMGDATGFVDRTSSTISFNDGTRTLTLSPTGANFTVYYKGKSVVISSAQTLTIANSSGSHWIHWDFNQNKLVDLGASPSIKDNLLVAYIYWDAVSSFATFFSDERHAASRDMNWHYYQHTTIGAIWKSGGDLSYTINNPNVVGIGITSSVVLADEDLEHTIVHSDVPANQFEQNINSSFTGLATLPIIYLNGTVYKQGAATSTPWYPSTTRAYYNQISVGSGSLVTAAADDSYIVYWIVATNDVRTPIKLVMGRTEWSTYSDAETENFESYGLPMPEIAPMYKVILKTRSSYTQNVARVNVVGVRELVGKQNARSNSFDTLSHDILSDRSLSDQHPISAITGLQTQLDSAAGAAVAMAIALG
jgi:hypothetical protein